MPQGQRLAPLIIPGGWCWVNLLLLPAMIHALRYVCILLSVYHIFSVLYNRCAVGVGDSNTVWASNNICGILN